jgi:hypothetical protein
LIRELLIRAGELENTATSSQGISQAPAGTNNSGGRECKPKLVDRHAFRGWAQQNLKI